MGSRILKRVRTGALLLLLAVILIHSVLWIIGAIGAYRWGMFLVDVEDFSDCKDSFDVLSEKWLPYYEAVKEKEESLLFLYVRHDFSLWTIQFEYEDPDQSRVETVAMTPEEAEAVKQVNQELSNDYTKGEAPPFCGITVWDGTVCFHQLSHQSYTVVYRESGWWPDAISREGEDFFCRRLSWRYFHGVIKEQE